HHQHGNYTTTHSQQPHHQTRIVERTTTTHHATTSPSTNPPTAPHTQSQPLDSAATQRRQNRVPSAAYACRTGRVSGAGSWEGTFRSVDRNAHSAARDAVGYRAHWIGQDDDALLHS